MGQAPEHHILGWFGLGGCGDSLDRIGHGVRSDTRKKIGVLDRRAEASISIILVDDSRIVERCVPRRYSVEMKVGGTEGTEVENVYSGRAASLAIDFSVTADPRP
jgi:hypothetical protein